MVHNQNLIDELIVKYARQEKLTEEGTLLLESWCSQSAGHRALLALYRDQVNHGKDLRALPPVPLTAIREKVALRIKKEKEKSVKTSRGFWRWPPRWRRSAPVALATFFLLVLGIKFWPKEHHHFPLHASGDSLVLVDGAYSNCELVISKERKPFNLGLPDGSWVVIQAGSRMILPDFESQNQVTQLYGVAYFTIERNKSRSFTVVGPNGMRARDLGTRFAFYAYGGKEDKVSLISGAVQVFHNRDNILLKPNEEAVLRGDSLVRQKMRGNAGLRHWSGDSLLIHWQNVDFAKAVEEIADWYDLKVENPQHVKGSPISTDAHRAPSLEKMIQEIRLAERGMACVEIKGGTIVISPYRTSTK
jgi:hypothetical protein